MGPSTLPLTAVSFKVSCNLGLALSPQNCLIRRPRGVFLIGEGVALIFPFTDCARTRVFPINRDDWTSARVTVGLICDVNTFLL